MPEESGSTTSTVAEAVATNPTGDSNGQGSDQSGAANNQGRGWLAGLPSDLRDKSEFQSMQKVGDLAKAYLDNQSKLAKAVVPPGDNARDDEVKAFREKLGVPENPDGYEIDSTGDEEFADVFRKAAHKEGLTPKQAKSLHEEIMKVSRDIMTKAQNERKAKMEEGQKSLKEEWGDKYEANDIAARRFAALAGAEMVDALTENGLIEDPRVIKGLHRFANMISEDRIVEGRGQRAADTGWQFPNTPGM